MVEAVAYTFSGMYGPVWQLGPIYPVLVIAQLVLGGLMVILLDECLQKGYGLGAGVNLFIATNICSGILWKCFSFVSLKTDNGTEMEGCVIALLHFIFVKPNKLHGI